MFDIGWSELVVIAVVALIAIGPKELPGVLRSVGYWMGKVRRMASEFQAQFQEAMREAEMADLKKTADELNDAAKSLTAQFNPLSDVEKGVNDLNAAPQTSSAAPPAEPQVIPPAAEEPLLPQASEPAPEPTQTSASAEAEPVTKGAA
jgi:sec-independent protein translocase protein TatB